jgi:3-oxoacyl-[acyl-carrier-protein] synthase II
MADRDLRPCVTGIGAVTPIGGDAASFWSSLISGRNGARPVVSFDTSSLPNHNGCEVENFRLAPALAASLLGGRCSELALAAADQALAASGASARYEGTDQLGVVVGTTMGDVTQFEQDRILHAGRPADTADVRTLAGRPLDVMARSIARHWSLEGPVLTVPAACAAGSYAIGFAASLVERGEVRAALAVGCEAFSRLAFVGFSRMHAMSPDLCRPFSAGRPGLLLGEGAGAVMIERWEDVRASGRPGMGFVDGFGLSCDAYHVTGPHPEGEGALRAMQDALSRAGVRPAEVDYINAHGTGTALNDKVESLAIRRLLEGQARSVPVSSIKALTGHMMGAAGAVEAIACLLAIRHGTIPPTWNWTAPDPECEIDCVPNEPRRAELRHVLSNSYAFGGNNASLLLSAPDQVPGAAGR